jgi:signal transduction histidine kinase
MADSRSSVSVARPLLVFGSVSLVAIVALGFAATALLRSTARREAIRDAKEITRLAGEGVAEPALGAGLLRGDQRARARLDGTVRRRLVRDPVVRVKLWTLDGRILYSDARRLEGRRFELEPAQRNAVRKREVEADLSDLTKSENVFERRFGKLLEVYLPIHAPDGTPLVFEEYFRFSAVTDSESRQLSRFAPVLIGALLLLWLVQLPLAASITRRLRQRQRERETLLERTLDSSEVERRRIAQHLHDSVVQDLAGVSYSLSATGEGLRRDGRETAAASVAGAGRAVRRAIRELRGLLIGLYPASLERSGLESAMADLIAPLSAQGMHVEVDLPPPEQLSHAVEDTLYRGAQEALRNVGKHSGAREVQVRVAVSDGLATLTVSDDGRGFEPADASSPNGHLGLRMLEDLIRERGGALRVRSSLDEGTQLTVEVPER